MKTRAFIIVATVTFVSLAVAPASAQAVGGITFHGFVSQGFLKSTDNNWITVPTEDGSFAFTELALNFNVEPVSKLRIGGQLFARDLGALGNNRVVVDWAVADYRFTDSFGLRAGKVKQPIGLYNILVDNPVARSEIITPTGIYPQSTRDYANAFQGVDAYGTFGLGGAGELDYELWGGTIDVDEIYTMERFITEGAYNALPMLGLDQPDVLVSDIRATVDYVVGGALEWRPILGLRLKVTATATDSEASGAAVYSGFTNQGPVPIPVSLTTRTQATWTQPYAYFVSAEYRRGGLRLAAEHYSAKTDVESSMSGLPFPVPSFQTTSRPLSCYGQAAYRLDQTWELSGYYSFLYLDKEDKDGMSYVVRGLPAHRAWLKQWNVSARADINRHWLVKAEANFFDGTATVSVLDNPEGLEQKWTLFALQTVVHF